MSHPLAELSVRAHVALASRARDARGQTAAEYLGVLLVISVIIATLSTTDLGHELTGKLSDLVRDIAGGDSGKAK